MTQQKVAPPAPKAAHRSGRVPEPAEPLRQDAAPRSSGSTSVPNRAICSRTALGPVPGRFSRRLRQSAPVASRAIKEVAMRGQSLPWTDAVRFGETMRKVAGATEDASEGRAASREKRTPTWKAR